MKAIRSPDGITQIGESVFAGCFSLADENEFEVHIPDSVTSIGRKLFLYAYGPHTIYAPAGSYAERYAKENNIPFVEEYC